MGSTEWLSITSREFHDLPRAFFVRCDDRWLYASSTLDQPLDDYGDYEMYDMGNQGPDSHTGSWVNVEHHAIAHLGAVPLTAESFDETRRLAVRRSALQQVSWW